MFGESAALGKALATIIAAKGLLARVHPAMAVRSPLWENLWPHSSQRKGF
jgi:hypothetical protein